MGHFATRYSGGPFPKKHLLPRELSKGLEKSLISPKLSPNINKFQKKFDWGCTDLQRSGWLSLLACGLRQPGLSCR
jgi:hypothetical protein